jgi:hypothetical protein
MASCCYIGLWATGSHEQRATWFEALIEKLIVAEVVKKLPASYRNQDLLLVLKKPALGLYADLGKTDP